MATAKAFDLNGAGPGERITFDALRAALPPTWHVVWGRDIPTAFVTQLQRETDFIVLGEHLLFIVEEKHWSGPYTGDAVTWWTADKAPRDSPLKQASDLARKLSGLIKGRFPTIGKAFQEYNQGRGGVGTIPIATPHVVLSEKSCSFVGVSDPRTATMCSRLDEAARRLVALDAEHEALTVLGDPQLREELIDYLDGLEQKADRTAIGAYELVETLPSGGSVQVFLARHPNGSERILTVLSFSNLPDPTDDVRDRVERETTALQRLNNSGVSPTVHDYFYEDERKTLVIPTDPIRDRRNLGSVIGQEPPPGLEEFVAVARLSFSSLARVHEAGVLHRNIHPADIWIPATPDAAVSVMLTGFSAARIEGSTSLTGAPQIAAEAVNYVAPELGQGYSRATRATDVYSLARSLAAYLDGRPAAHPAPDGSEFGPLPQAVAQTLRAALSANALERPEISAILVALENPAPAVAAGCALPRGFDVEIELGSGATATTYRATDHNMAEPATRAIKVFTGSYAIDRINGEVKVLEQLAHPHIVHYFAAGGRGVRVDEEDVCPYLVYEYLEGQTLEAYAVSTRALPGVDQVDRYRTFLIEALDALELLSRRRLVHRDLKPRNFYIHQADDGEERLVILDFGQAARVGTVGIAGTPFFRDVLHDAPDEPWQATSDLYSLAATFYFGLTGLLPFERDEYDLPNKHLLVGPVGTDETSRVFQQRLLRALDPSVDNRYPTAAEFRRAIEEPIQIEIPPRPRALKRAVNPTVDKLRPYYRNSSVGNGANRGIGGSFGEETYVETRLDTELLPAVLRGELTLVLFAGNPGDGKTTFLERFAKELDRLQCDLIEENQAGWKRAYLGRTYVAVNDASASSGVTSADEYVHAVLEPLAGYEGEDTDFTILVAANDGRLLNLFSESPYYQHIAQVVTDQLLADSPVSDGGRVRVLDFKRRSLVNPIDSSESLVVKTVQAATKPEMWRACLECRAQDVCPILFNARSLFEPSATGPTSRLHDLFMTVHLRRQSRLTIRDLRSVVSFVVTGDLSCEQIHDELDRSENPMRHDRLYFWNATAGPPDEDIGLEQLHELDPDVHISASVDRVLHQRVDVGWDAFGPSQIDDRSGRARVPTRLFAGDEATQVNRRRFFFEGDTSRLVPAAESGELDHARQFSPYRHLPRFALAAAGHPEPDELSVVLRGASRVIGVFGYEGDGLAVHPPTTTATDSTVVKVFSSLDFRIEPLPQPEWVEHMADQLQLVYGAGSPRIYLSLDGFELLHRAADGYLPTHPEISSLLEELKVFARQLMQGVSREIMIVDPNGSAFRVREAERTIELASS